MREVYKSYKTACFAMAREAGATLQSHGGGWFNLNGRKIQGLREVYKHLMLICTRKGIKPPKVEEKKYL